MKAKYLMSAPAITVQADTSLKEIIRLINVHQISGVPVIDAAGKVVGTISWPELFPTAKIVRSPDVRIPTVFKEIIDLKNIADGYKQSAQLTAKDIMTPAPVCVDTDDHVGQVVWTMIVRNLHLVPVVSGDTLVGVLTRRDFIRFLAQEL